MEKSSGTLITALLFFVVLLITALVDANAVGKKKIAVLKVKPNNISIKYAELVEELLVVHLFKTKAFEILERNKINMILKEQEFTAACTTTDCAVKIGQLLSADIVVVGGISKFGKYTISIKLIDIAQSSLQYADTETTLREEDIQNAINALSKRAAEYMSKPAEPPVKPVPEKIDIATSPTNESPEKPTEIPAGYYLRGFIPGWSQIYAGNAIRGSLFMSGFILTAAFTGYTVYDFAEKKDTYNNIDSTNTQREFINSRDDRDIAYNRMNLMLGITAAIYAVNWIDVLFFSRPERKNEDTSSNHVNIKTGIDLCSSEDFISGMYIKAGFCMRF